MNNYFIELYKKLQSMSLDGRSLDSILNSLPWKLVETKPDGTEIYECEVKSE